MKDQNEQGRSSRDIVEILAIVAFCLVIFHRFSNVFVYPPDIEAISDGLRHWINAQDTLAETPSAVWDPPLYQLYLSVIQRLSGGLPALLTWYCALLSVTALLAWLWPLSELFSKKHALLYASVLGLLPEWTSLYSFLLNETLFLPLFGCSLGATFAFLRLRTMKSLVLAGSFWFLLSLTRGIGLPLGAVAFLFMLYHLPWKQRGSGIALSLLITLPVLVPLSIRNFERYQIINPFGSYRANEVMARTGAFSHTLDMKRDGDIWNFGFDSGRGIAKPLHPLSSYRTIRRGKVKIAIDLSEGGYQEAVSVPFVGALRALQLIADDTIFTLFGVPWPHVSEGSPYGTLGKHTRWAWPFLFFLLPILCLFRRPLYREEQLLGALIIVWTAVQCGGLFVPGQARYRLPFEALSLLLVFSLFGRKRNCSVGENI